MGGKYRRPSVKRAKDRRTKARRFLLENAPDDIDFNGVLFFESPNASGETARTYPHDKVLDGKVIQLLKKAYHMHDAIWDNKPVERVPFETLRAAIKLFRSAYSIDRALSTINPQQANFAADAVKKIKASWNPNSFPAFARRITGLSEEYHTAWDNQKDLLTLASVFGKESLQKYGRRRRRRT